MQLRKSTTRSGIGRNDKSIASNQSFTSPIKSPYPLHPCQEGLLAPGNCLRLDLLLELVNTFYISLAIVNQKLLRFTRTGFNWTVLAENTEIEKLSSSGS